MIRSSGAAVLFAAICLGAATGTAAAADNKVKTETIIVPTAPDKAPDAGGGQPAPADAPARGDEAVEDAVPAEAIDEADRSRPGLHRIPLGAIESDTAGAPVADEAPPETEKDAGPLPDVIYDPEQLPAPVRRMREQILEAAKTGDVEQLRPVLESNEVMPTLSLGEVDDPISFLKLSSGDEDGREILAILIEVLDAGFVHVDAGTAQDMYIWPYFARMPLDKLTPPQQVELYKLLTAQDVRDMEDFGTYVFYRVGIGPDGTWHYFVAGE
ncbi:MAG: hypothetical protein R3D02_13130 [Hyphomicrobiales bacterium]